MERLLSQGLPASIKQYSCKTACEDRANVRPQCARKETGEEGKGE